MTDFALSDWRDIPGHPFYLANTDGEIYSTLTSRVLKSRTAGIAVAVNDNEVT